MKAEAKKFVEDRNRSVRERLRKPIDDEIREAVEAEREACAKIADEEVPSIVDCEYREAVRDVSLNIAQAIRARGESDDA